MDTLSLLRLLEDYAPSMKIASAMAIVHEVNAMVAAATLANQDIRSDTVRAIDNVGPAAVPRMMEIIFVTTGKIQAVKQFRSEYNCTLGAAVYFHDIALEAISVANRPV